MASDSNEDVFVESQDGDDTSPSDRSVGSDDEGDVKFHPTNQSRDDSDSDQSDDEEGDVVFGGDNSDDEDNDDDDDSDGIKIDIDFPDYGEPGDDSPPRAQTMSADGDDPIDAGLAFLASIDGLYVQQRVEVFEALTGCDTKNVYHVTPIPAGVIPLDSENGGTLPTEWLSHFRAQSELAPLLIAKETSTSCARLLCPLHRELNMAFQDGAEETFFSIHRPFKCTIPGMCFLLNPQEVTLFDADGEATARVVEEHKCGWFCTHQFTAQTFDGEPGEPAIDKFHLRVPECHSSKGCNFLAPSCMNRDYDMDIFGVDELEVVGHATAVWPGCNCGGLTDRSNLVLRFPRDSSPKERASLVAALFLVEFYHFESKRQN